MWCSNQKQNKKIITGNSRSVGQQIHWHGQIGPLTVKIGSPVGVSITNFDGNTVHL